jgi:DNA invertase Pin-like site-specific DNA recombinase
LKGFEKMRIFYERVSHKNMNLARQQVIAEELKAEKIFSEKVSGKNTDRAELQKMLSFVREGDIVIVESISRIARNTKDLLNIIETLTNKGVDFISQKENIDTSTPQGKFMLTIFGALAEFEREQTLQRQAEGIAIAKAEGKYKGKPKTEYNKDEFIKECAAWHEGKQTARDIMRKFEMSSNTFYRRVKEWNLEKK